jgi:hypothetical protein
MTVPHRTHPHYYSYGRKPYYNYTIFLESLQTKLRRRRGQQSFIRLNSRRFFPQDVPLKQDKIRDKFSAKTIQIRMILKKLPIG